jgi:uncharacterized membrane protein
MESKMALTILRLPLKQKGQAMVQFAVFLPVLIILLMIVADTAITSARLMDAVAVSDLAAHAGAQEVKVLPNGKIEPSENAENVAAAYFMQQAPPYVSLVSIVCDVRKGKPACELVVRVHTAGVMVGQNWITVRALGYLAYGVTRDDQ